MKIKIKMQTKKGEYKRGLKKRGSPNRRTLKTKPQSQAGIWTATLTGNKGWSPPRVKSTSELKNVLRFHTLLAELLGRWGRRRRRQKERQKKRDGGGERGTRRRRRRFRAIWSHLDLF